MMKHLKKILGHPSQSVKYCFGGTVIFLGLTVCRMVFDVDGWSPNLTVLYYAMHGVAAWLLVRGLAFLHEDSSQLRKIDRYQRRMDQAYDNASKAIREGDDELASMYLEQYQLFYKIVKREREDIRRKIEKRENGQTRRE